MSNASAQFGPRPRSRPEDLGLPLPDSPYAVSVCLPTWADNIGYEEQDPRVIDVLQSGYPRFVLPPSVRQLFAEASQDLAASGEALYLFPSRRVAERAAHYVRRLTRQAARTMSWKDSGLYAVLTPVEESHRLKQYWQHAGEITSSRCVQSVRQGINVSESFAAGEELRQSIRERVAEFAGADPTDVYLFPTGMAAFACAFRACQILRPSARSIQFGFPYVDILKVQQRIGSEVEFYPEGHEKDLDSVAHALTSGASASEPYLGVFCEFPGNPLLTSPDLARLSKLTRDARVPLLVDDTLGAIINTTVRPACDLQVTSLTKYFSGAGDVMGGSLILNPDRPLYASLKASVEREFEQLIHISDAEVLEANSCDVRQRVQQINATTEALCDWLTAHPAVARVDYPKYRSPERYRQFAQPHAGFGGLFSMDLVDAERIAPRFFDALNLNKGPNLGTNFTLCCPYTILAHYDELDFAERCGISRFLVRVSVGLESAEWLRAQFEAALDFAMID